LNILLASHGTLGARAAEKLTYDLCLKYKSSFEISLTHLYVIPEFWKNMLADDWLSNVSTHIQFENYLQNELKQEAEDNTKRIRFKLDSLKIDNQPIIKFGEPNKCLINTCLETNFDLVIIGSRRPKSMHGLSSIMNSEKLPQNIPAKLLQVPHPIH